ncbi:colanic acid biosynthesis phosphomannomutase CpsG [Arenicella sp. 4NH20-0111]|uniref:phosphomannomutase n=1 Tax=Arenicella sp. 4NH20-0111 TaxID=3127648 RepID=UPI00310B8BD4
MNKARCFKAYDVRGRVPEDLNEDIAYKIGRAFVLHLKAKEVAVGHDIRLSSPSLLKALISGITDEGANVINLGLCGTEEIYHAAFSTSVDGGIVVTASHNPENYNGMKFVAAGARPISGETGLKKIQSMVETSDFPPTSVRKGGVRDVVSKTEYISHLLGYIDISKLRRLKIVVNSGNGGAGPIIDLLEKELPFDFIKVHHDPDGSFPNGVPNPLLIENRNVTSAAIEEHDADLGIAWDGDFDRCFFFDENGDFISGYYIVGLLARLLLDRDLEPNRKIIHDPRLTWNTIDAVRSANGVPVMSKTGHAFIKERMRSEDAIYGGEISAHHYFKGFGYCDSGMIPWLLLAELLSTKEQPFSNFINEAKSLFPSSDEINFNVDEPERLVDLIEQFYSPLAVHIEKIDGLSIGFSDWRFNIRMSNTEPVVRLNVETRQSNELLLNKISELEAKISEFSENKKSSN